MPRDKGYWINLKSGKAKEVYDHESELFSNPKSYYLTADRLRGMKDRRERLIAAMKKGFLRMRKQRGYIAWEHHWRDRPMVMDVILTFMKKNKRVVWPEERMYISHVNDGVDFEGTAKDFIEKFTPKKGKGVRYDPKTAPRDDWGHETEIFNMLRKRIYKKKGIPYESEVPFETQVEIVHEAFQTMGSQRNVFDLERLLSDLGFKVPEVEVYEPLDQFGTVSEAGLSRVWAKTKEPFAIITSFRDDPSRGSTPAARLKANRQMNKKLLSFLNSNRMGAYKLIGHWEEAPEGMSYAQAKARGMTQDVTEESFMVPKPKDMPEEEFRAAMVSLMRAYKQDAIVYGDGTSVMLIFQDGSTSGIGSKPSFNRVAQAYSQLRNRPGVPFVFEGVAAPINVTSRQAFDAIGLYWPSAR
jgi:hypothetical protein